MRGRTADGCVFMSQMLFLLSCLLVHLTRHVPQVYCTHCCKERVATTASRKPVRSCRECADFLAGMEADYAPLEGAVRKLTIPE